MQYPPNSTSALREPINYDVSEIKEIKPTLPFIFSDLLWRELRKIVRKKKKKKKKNAVLLKLAEQANYLKSSSRF